MYELHVSADFLNSPYRPPCCFFSGRTDGLFENSVALDYFSTADQVQNGVQQILRRGWSDPPKPTASVVITFLFHPAAYRAWRVRRFLARVAPFVTGLIGVIAGLSITEAVFRQDGAWSVVIGAVAGLALGWWIQWWLTRSTASMKLVNATGDVRLRFAESQLVVFRLYEAGWQRYLSEELLRLPPVRQAGADDEESWADSPAGEKSRWDESGGKL